MAVQQFITHSPSLFEPFKDEDVHGGPPVVLIPQELSKTGQPYFLGILHFFKVGMVKEQCPTVYDASSLPWAAVLVVVVLVSDASKGAV